MVSPSPLPLTGSSSGEPKAMGARHPQHELAIRRASVVSGRLTMGLRLQEPPLWVLHARLWRTVIPAGAAVFRGRSALPACSVVSEGIEATPSVSWPATWKRRRAFSIGTGPIPGPRTTPRPDEHKRLTEKPWFFRAFL